MVTAAQNLLLLLLLQNEDCLVRNCDRCPKSFAEWWPLPKIFCKMWPLPKNSCKVTFCSEPYLKWTSFFCKVVNFLWSILHMCFYLERLRSNSGQPDLIWSDLTKLYLTLHIWPLYTKFSSKVHHCMMRWVSYTSGDGFHIWIWSAFRVSTAHSGISFAIVW